MNGKMAGTKPLYVALAQRKEDRRMRLQAQFAQRAVAAGGMPNMGPYGMPPPGVPGAMYYGQPPPGAMGPPQPQPGFGFPVMPPGPGRPMGPGGPNMQYVMPMPQRQVPGQRGRGGRGGQGGGRGQGRQNMRGYPQNQPPAPLPGAPPPGEPVEANPVAVLAAQLPTATPDQQRMLLGEALYPLVDAVEPASSAKITGMLLEMDQSEVLHLIEDAGALRAKVQEALAVLKAAAAEEGN
jgi:polyadenylate-binding protein